MFCNWVIYANNSIQPCNVELYDSWESHSANSWFIKLFCNCIFCWRHSLQSCDHKKDCWMQALTTAAQLPFCIIDRICTKSSLKTVEILLKTWSSVDSRFWSVQCTASKQYLYCISTLSQIIRSVFCIKSVSWVLFSILQFANSCSFRTILKWKCEVQSLSSKTAAISEEITHRTILSLAQ